jgi:hypothetical protein
MTDEEALNKAMLIVGAFTHDSINGRDFIRIEGDPESAHVRLDELLCEILKEHGYAKLVEFYQKLDLWYS